MLLQVLLKMAVLTLKFSEDFIVRLLSVRDSELVSDRIDSTAP